MQQIAERINKLSESATIKMARLSRELKDQGTDIISLSLGEPDFDTPQHIKDAAMRAIQENYSHYPPVAGYPELRKVISEKLKKELDLSYGIDQIVVSTGAKQSLINVFLSILNENDEIIIPSPYWVSYPEMAKLADAKMVNIATLVKDRFKITPAQLEQTITNKTKAFLLCSPSNPTGSFYSKEELQQLAKVLAKYPDIYIISDEIYDLMNFVGKHYSIAQYENLYERTIIINGVSKSYAMTGWRIGYLAGPKPISDACIKIQGQFTSGANTIAQKAAETAISNDQSPTLKMRDAFRERRDLVVKHLEEIEGIECYLPDGAFYVFPNVSAFYGKSFQGEQIKNSEEFCMYILENALVSMVPGKPFGNDNCVRISFAASKSDLEKAMLRIKKVLALLK